ncbi:MAG: hypothetical protein M1813_008901 [Trichoglossum hirsutum]|nr:MAG: hypothetical protein M1813_008901 [Trichoglossum hirsutum]
MSTNESERNNVTEDGHLQEPDAQVPGDAPAELTAVVDELLNSLSSRFSSVSSEIFSKMDEMSRRLDSLEANLQANGTNQGK